MSVPVYDPASDELLEQFSRKVALEAEISARETEHMELLLRRAESSEKINKLIGTKDMLRRKVEIIPRVIEPGFALPEDVFLKADPSRSGNCFQLCRRDRVFEIEASDDSRVLSVTENEHALERYNGEVLHVVLDHLVALLASSER